MSSFQVLSESCLPQKCRYQWQHTQAIREQRYCIETGPNNPFISCNFPLPCAQLSCHKKVHICVWILIMMLPSSCNITCWGFVLRHKICQRIDGKKELKKPGWMVPRNPCQMLVAYAKIDKIHVRSPISVLSDSIIVGADLFLPVGGWAVTPGLPGAWCSPGIFLVEARGGEARGGEKRGEAPMTCCPFRQISFVHEWAGTKKDTLGRLRSGRLGKSMAVQLDAVAFSRVKIISLFSAFLMILPSIKPPSSTLMVSHAKIPVVTALLSF